MTPQEEATARRIARAIVDADHDPWQLHAACAASPVLVASPTPETVWSGLRLCAGCPVTKQCAAWSEQEPGYTGISAGTVRGRLGRLARRPIAS